MRSKAAYGSAGRLAGQIRAARGEVPADLVIRGASWLDVFSGTFQSGDVAVHDGHVVGVGETYEGRTVVRADGCFVVPGFIDAHVHIESSLMTPGRFAQAVLPFGTTAVVWDPHEIANVHGTEGIDWALQSSEGLPLDVFVMIPSCVPSTSPGLGFETSGAVLHAGDLQRFRAHPRVTGLAEMMNFPGLLGGDPDIMTKLTDFSSLRRDGHCPGLTGKDLNAYGVAGIHSCHESTSAEEAREKMRKGINVLIREGSCAKDADRLLPVLTPMSSACVAFCSDDRNPLDIEAEGHVVCIVNKALAKGHAPEVVFRAASWAPAMMFGLADRGAVAPGYQADLVCVRPVAGSWTRGIEIATVYKAGQDVRTLLRSPVGDAPAKEARPGGGRARNLNMPPVAPDHFAIQAAATGSRVNAHVIGVIPGQIISRHLQAEVPVRDGRVVSDPARDILKIAVLERHHNTGGRAVGLVQGFGLKRAAIATSINHDSHNVIVVGPDDQLMTAAVRRLQELDGGIVVMMADGSSADLPLPIGGLMTDREPAAVATSLRRLKELARAGGCTLEEPFLQLSFLALPVIPALKITDKGLVDVERFRLISLTEST